MSLSPRLIAPDKRGEDADMSLRPQTLDEFVGQAAIRANLKVFIEAAKGRGEALDHVLFVGPPGLGKTTLAQIMARELGVNFRSTSGPVIAKAGDLAALLTNPLRDRFGIPIRLNFYSVEELETIVRRGARILSMPLGDDGALEIARRARGTPRIAGRLLRRVRDFASVAGAEHVSRAVADAALSRLEVDALGLDQLDRRYLTMIAANFGGGPVGIETIAAGLSEPRDAIEDIIEPYLIQQGFIQRTPRGRVLTANAWKHLGLDAPKDLAQQQINLFQEE